MTAVHKTLLLIKLSFGNESSYIISSASAVIHNQPPVISGQNANLGTKREGFTHAYTVTDPDNDVVTVVEKVDGTTLRSYKPTLGNQNTLSVTGNAFTALSNAAHTITMPWYAWRWLNVPEEPTLRASYERPEFGVRSQ